MKIAIAADLHFRGKDLAAARAQIWAMFDGCHADTYTTKVDYLCIAGDIFDRESIGDGKGSTGDVCEVFANFLHRLDDPVVNVNVPVVMIDGNHDVATVGGSALKAIERTGSAKYLAAPGWHSLVVDPNAFIVEDELPFAVFAFPWQWLGDAEDAVKAAFEVPSWAESVPKLFLGHVQVGGAFMGGQSCPEGPGTWRISRATVEKLGQVFDRVALGDFHRRQPDLAGPGKGGYVGALRQLNHGEEGNPAGFEIWDTETNAVEWIELNAAPRYRTVEVRDGEEIPKAGENEILQVKTIGWAPTRLMAADIESDGVTKIMPIPVKTERVARGGELPAGALSDKPALLRMWCEDKGHGPGVYERLAGRLAEGAAA